MARSEGDKYQFSHRVTAEQVEPKTVATCETRAAAYALQRPLMSASASNVVAASGDVQ